jgi:hypothetical protein
MATDQVFSNQESILSNQERIPGNQESLEKNQAKLPLALSEAIRYFFPVIPGI